MITIIVKYKDGHTEELSFDKVISVGAWASDHYGEWTEIRFKGATEVCG